MTKSSMLKRRIIKAQYEQIIEDLTEQSTTTEKSQNDIKGA